MTKSNSIIVHGHRNDYDQRDRALLVLRDGEFKTLIRLTSKEIARLKRALDVAESDNVTTVITPD